MQAMGNSQHLDQLMDAQLRDEAKEHSKKLKKFKKVQIHLASLCLWNVVLSNLQMQALPLMMNLPYVSKKPLSGLSTCTKTCTMS